MKNRCNIFQYAPKELCTDAFLAWLFSFLDSDPAYQNAKNDLFKALFLKDEDLKKNIGNTTVFLQRGGKNGRTDVQLSFMFNNELESHTLLFENKTWSGTSIKQLKGYKEDFPNMYKYIFLKLGYISIEDMSNANFCGYEVIDCFMLKDAIEPMRHLHQFIEQYCEYIEETFCNHISSFENELFKKENYGVLGENHGEAQHYLMGIVFNNLAQHKTFYNTLRFQEGTSSGRPWTEVVFEENSVHYNNSISEALFWRVDCRGKGYYLRINQYAEIKDNNDLIKIKEERLSKLRNIGKETLSEYPQIVPGATSNRWGANESEVLILFLDDNNLTNLINQISDLTLSFMKKYNQTMR